MQDFDIIFYDKPDGTEPVKEFLDSLDVKMRAKMIRTIVILQKMAMSCVNRIQKC